MSSENMIAKNSTEELLVKIFQDKQLATRKKIELMASLAFPDQSADYAAGQACAVCPPPQARPDFLDYLLDKFITVGIGYIENLDFFKVDEIDKLNQGEMEVIEGIVLHRTASPLKNSLNSARSSGVGAHYYIDKKGGILKTLSHDKYTFHVGPIKSRCDDEKNCSDDDKNTYKEINSRKIPFKDKVRQISDLEKNKAYPARYPHNETTIGIEVEALYLKDIEEFEKPTAEQLKSLNILINFLKNKHNLTDDDIYEHDKISRKTPGEGADLYIKHN